MKTIVAVLAILLLASNIFWVYRTVDESVTVDNRDQQIFELSQTMGQLMAVLPEVAINHNQYELVAIVSKHGDGRIQTKGDCTLVGRLGLKFNDKGKLHSVSPNLSSDQSNVCLQ